MSKKPGVITERIKYPNLYGYTIECNSICRNCRFRKEYYKDIPQECKECEFLDQRSEPYLIRLPIWEDGYIPTVKDMEYFTKHYRAIGDKETI